MYIYVGVHLQQEHVDQWQTVIGFSINPVNALDIEWQFKVKTLHCVFI